VAFAAGGDDAGGGGCASMSRGVRPDGESWLSVSHANGDDDGVCVCGGVGAGQDGGGGDEGEE